jgi:hypothetical protein
VPLIPPLIQKRLATLIEHRPLTPTARTAHRNIGQLYYPESPPNTPPPSPCRPHTVRKQPKNHTPQQHRAPPDPTTLLFIKSLRNPTSSQQPSLQRPRSRQGAPPQKNSVTPPFGNSQEYQKIPPDPADPTTFRGGPCSFSTFMKEISKSNGFMPLLPAIPENDPL